VLPDSTDEGFLGAPALFSSLVFSSSSSAPSPPPFGSGDTACFPDPARSPSLQRGTPPFLSSFSTKPGRPGSVGRRFFFRGGRPASPAFSAVRPRLLSARDGVSGAPERGGDHFGSFYRVFSFLSSVVPGFFLLPFTQGRETFPPCHLSFLRLRDVPSVRGSCGPGLLTSNSRSRTKPLLFMS